MVKSEYLLVLWNEENRHSVVKRLDICSEKIKKKKDENLLSMETEIFWNGTAFTATILNLGTKDELMVELNNIEKASKKRKAPAEKKESKRQKLAESASQISSVLENLPTAETEQQESICKDCQTWKEKYEKELESKQKYKNRNKTLNGEISKLKEQVNTEGMADLGHGVKMTEVDYLTIKQFSTKIGQFVRNLMRVVFTKEEMIGHTVFGQTCNANKKKKKKKKATDENVDEIGNEKEVAPKAALNKKKRCAVIETAVKEYGLPGIKKDPTKSQVIKIMGDFLRELTLKHANNINETDEIPTE